MDEQRTAAAPGAPSNAQDPRPQHVRDHLVLVADATPPGKPIVRSVERRGGIGTAIAELTPRSQQRCAALLYVGEPATVPGSVVQTCTRFTDLLARTPRWVPSPMVGDLALHLRGGQFTSLATRQVEDCSGPMSRDWTWLWAVYWTTAEGAAGAVDLTTAGTKPLPLQKLMAALQLPGGLLPLPALFPPATRSGWRDTRKLALTIGIILGMLTMAGWNVYRILTGALSLGRGLVNIGVDVVITAGLVLVVWLLARRVRR